MTADAVTLDTPADEPYDSAIDAVFEGLLRDIVAGNYRAGTRLPPERALSQRVGASRATLREALRRLGEWNLVEPRRGSGVVVRPYREWSIEVIGAYLRHGKPEPDQPSISQVLLDVFALRRSVVVEMIRLVTPRIDGSQLEGARAAMARAWAQRNEPGYANEDFQVMRHIVEAAKFAPGLWLLNSFAAVWVEAAASIRSILRPPPDYVSTHARLFELIDAHDADAACKLMADYLDRHDAKIVGALAGATS
jgi:GntR family transcriptional repressor for pyruvate dehydrogenase complex